MLSVMFSPRTRKVTDHVCGMSSAMRRASTGPLPLLTRSKMTLFDAPGRNLFGASTRERERSLMVRTLTMLNSSPVIVIPLRCEVMDGVIGGAMSPACAFSGAVIFAVNVVLPPGLMTASGLFGCSICHIPAG